MIWLLTMFLFSHVTSCIAPSPYVEGTYGDANGEEVGLVTGGAYFPLGERQSAVQDQLESEQKKQNAILLDLSRSLSEFGSHTDRLDTVAAAFDVFSTEITANTEELLARQAALEARVEEVDEAVEAESQKVRDWLEKYGPESLLGLLLLGGGGAYLAKRRRSDSGSEHS